MHHRFLPMLPALCALLLTACGPGTELVGTWKDAQSADLRFRRLLVAAVAKDPWRRTMFEQAMQKELRGKGVEAIGSMEVMPLEEQLSKDNIQKAVNEKNIDGVIVMRLVEVDKTQAKVYDPAVLYGYGTFYAYYAYALATINTPGYVMSDRVVRIETSLFDAKDGRLVWNGLSDSANPSKFSEITGPLSTVVVRELGAEGFIPR